PATRAEEVAEEVADDVLEAATEVEAAEPALLEGGVPETIVAAAALGIGEYLIGLADLLEALLGPLVARVLIRVILERGFAVGLLELFVAAAPGAPQPLVVVALHHSPATTESPHPRCGG